MPISSPNDISGCVLWLRADSIGVSDGSTFQTWDDESTAGTCDATQSSAGARPTYRATGGPLNRPYADFLGDDVLGLVGTTSLTNFTFFLIQKMVSGDAYPFFMGGTTNTTGLYVGLESRNASSGSSEDVCDVIAGFGNDARATITGITKYGEWRLISVRVPGQIHSTTVRAGRSDASMGTTGSDQSMNVQMGVAGGTGIGGLGGAPQFGIFTVCQIAEVIAYNSALSAGDIVDVENYLFWKYFALRPGVATVSITGHNVNQYQSFLTPGVATVAISAIAPDVIAGVANKAMHNYRMRRAG